MPRLRRDTAQRRRSAILDAAVDCFAERGFHETTIADICTRAGVSTGALYVWFDSKEAIVEAVAGQRHERERSLLEQTFGAGTREGLRAALAGYLEWLGDPAERQRRRVSVQIWSEALTNPRLHALVLRGVAQRNILLERVQRAQAEGTLPAVQPDGLLRVFLALIQGVILQQAWEPDLELEPYREAIQRLIDELTSDDAKARATGKRGSAAGDPAGDPRYSPTAPPAACA